MSGEAAGQTTDPVLARFLRSLAARDASPHTQRAYATAVGSYLEWLAARGTDWRRPTRADLRAYLGVLGEGRARSSVAQRLAAIRSFHRWATRSDLAPGDPWGAIATPRLPRRLPRVLEVEQVDALLAVVEADLEAVPGDDPEHAALRLALALRDRALVETAYAAGLRISELAGATLGALDLRRGEIRVLGKGRKERIGLLGRPARQALEDYLEDGRPILLERGPATDPPPAEIFLNHLGGPLGVRGLRYRFDRLCVRAGLPVGVSPAHAAAFLRDAPARRRRRPAGGPGAARPREPGDDPDLHPRVARSTPGCLSGGPSTGQARPDPVTAGQGLARAGMVVSGAFLISRLLGYVRFVVIGNSGLLAGELDTFFAAFRLPDLIFQLVAAGALSSALIPVVSALLVGGEESHAWRVVSTVINLMLIALTVLAISLFILAPVVMEAITPGFGPAQLDKTVELTRTMLLSPIFLALGAVATSVLNSRGRFAAAALAPIVYNLVIILAALVLVTPFGVEGLAIGVVARLARPPARPDPAAGAARLPLHAADRPSRPTGAQGTPADGAPGDRARRDADHVHRRDRARDDGRGRCAGRLQLRLRAPADPPRDHRGPARDRRPAVTVAERSGRRGGIVRDAADEGVAAARLRHGADHRADRDRRASQSSRSCSAAARSPSPTWT